MRRKASLLLVLAFALLWSSAGSSSAQAPLLGGTLTVGLVGSPSSLTPLLYTSQTAADILSATSDGLLRYAPKNWPLNDQHYVWTPDLLAAMPSIRIVGTPGPNALVTITYRLRQGLRWSDGAPLTAQDIRFTWQAVTQPGNGAYQAGYDQITAIDTPNPQTAIVHMTGTFAAWQTLFPALLPYHALHGRLQRIAQDVAYSQHPLSDGPYVAAEGRHAVVLTPNRYYSGQDGPAPQLRAIRIRFYPSQSALLGALHTGTVQVADLLQTMAPDMASLIGTRFLSVPGPSFEQFTFNLFDSVAADLAVRRAFYLALDREAISSALSQGRWTLATSDQAPFGWAYDPQLPLVRQNAFAARSILMQDGWTIGKDGYFQKAGQELAITVSMTQTPLHEAIMKAVTQQEARVGIRLSAVYYPAQALFGPSGMLARGNYQASLFALVDQVDPNDAEIWNNQIGNRYTFGEDFSAYNSTQVNAWTQDGLLQMSMALRAADYHAVQQQLAVDLPMVPLFFTSVEAAYDPKAVTGITLSDFGGVLWTANRWRIP